MHPSQAQLRVALTLEYLDVTADAPLAGEETFGNAQVSIAAFDATGRPLGGERIRRAFEDPERHDPGMLGDAWRDAVVQAVNGLPVPPAAAK